MFGDQNAINARSLEQFFRDRGEIVAKQQRQNWHTKDRMHKHQPADGSHQTNLTQQDHDWIQHGLIRNEGTNNQDRKKRFRPFEFPIAQRIAVHGRDHDRK